MSLPSSAGPEDQRPALPGKTAPPGVTVTLGKYSLLRELGRGGMGIVYEALDTELQRRVALKMMRANPDADPEETRLEEERFLREARVGASLQKHPNLVAVYEAGVIGGRRYIAMELIDGKPMSDWRKLGSITLRQQITVLRDTSLAVHHAHELNVIHRDLKPQNILVDEKGRPHVTDLGLSKKTGQDTGQSLSVSGTIVGTPSYMSPEQAQGLKTIDRRTDLYSMGIMLYEVLTGRTPFGGQTAVEILVKVVKNPIPPPSAVLKRASVPVDPALEKICMKAVAKKPADRYPTAKEFADDLTRWLKGEEVQVTPPTMSVPPSLRAGRKKILWLSIGAGAVLLVAAVLILALPSSADRHVASMLAQARRHLAEGSFSEAAELYESVLRRDPENALALEGKAEARKGLDNKEHLEKERAQKAKAEIARAREEESRKRDTDQKAADAEFAKIVAERAKADAEAKSKELEAERRRLEELERSRSDAAQRALAERATPSSALPAARVPLSRTLSGHQGPSLCAIFSPDGAFLATGGVDRTLKVWDRASGRLLQTLQGHAGNVNSVAFDPSGPRLASSGLDGTIRFWDRDQGKEIRAIPNAHPGGIDSIAYSPDGKLLVSGGRDRKVRFWDAVSGKEIKTLTGHVMNVNSVSFSPDGRLAASGAADSFIRLWEAPSGRQIRPLAGHLHQVRAVAIASGSKLAVSGCNDGTVKLWNLVTGKEIRSFAGHSDEVTGVAFHPTGTLVASSARDGVVKLWNVATGKEVRSFSVPGLQVNSVCFSPDGATVAWSSQSGGIGLWSVPDLALSQKSVPLPAEDRLPIPDSAKQRVAEKKIRDLNKAEHAARGSAEAKALGEKLYQLGLGAFDDVTDRWVLLREARDMAILASDAGLAMAAIEELDELYAVDRVGLKIEALGKFTITGRTAEEARAITAQYLRLVDEAVEGDDYERARSVASRLEFAAKAAKDEALVARVQSSMKEVSRLQAEYARARAAEKRLEQAPSDSASALVAGRFWCLSKGDWEKGLPFLAKGPEPLRTMAEKELSPAPDQEAAVELCEAWLSAAEKEEGPPRAALAARARAWYRAIAFGLDSARRQRIDSRLRPF